MMDKATQLTDEQQRLVFVYLNKWKNIAFSTVRINQQRAAEIVRSVYKLGEQAEPRIIFFDSPLQMLQELGDPSSGLPIYNLFAVATGIHKQLRNQLSPHLWRILWKRQGALFGIEINRHVSDPVISALMERLGYALNTQTINQICQLSVIGDVVVLDFIISELKCQHSFEQQWQYLKLLIKNCPWHFAFEGTCIICDNPVSLSLENNLEFVFSDGWVVRGETNQSCFFDGFFFHPGTT